MTIACPHYSREAGNRRHGQCAVGHYNGKPYAGQCRQCLTGGPGTELKKLLAKIGLKETPGCKCKSRAAEMDRRGPDWCEAHVETIVAWMAEEAARRRLPFIHSLGVILTRLAIRRFRQRSWDGTKPDGRKHSEAALTY